VRTFAIVYTWIGLVTLGAALAVIAGLWLEQRCGCEDHLRHVLARWGVR
jgi:predicted outer membrane lipoprotein